MELTIKTLESSDEKVWDDVVFSSTHGTIFHTIDWLKIEWRRMVQMQPDTEFLPLMVYKGSNPVAIYPIFILKKGLIKVALSPPPRSKMLFLGPVIAGYDSLKQEKKESRYIKVQESLDNYIFQEKACKYAKINTSPALYDSRPLSWAGYAVNPLYTYRIDLTKGIQAMWDNLDRHLRGNINKAMQAGVTVREGDKEDLLFVLDSVLKRYLEQNIKMENYKEYLLDIYTRFYPDNLKIFVAEHRDRPIGGVIDIHFKNIMYGWMGLTKTNLEGISVNDLIQWEVIKAAQKNGAEYYDLMDDGDIPRLRFFKSKFNPDLAIWYSAKKYSSKKYKIGETVYCHLKKQVH
jgi:hypothetical protein